MHKDSKIKHASIVTDKRVRKPTADDQYSSDLFLIKRVLESYETCISLPPISTPVLNEDGDMQRQKTLLPASTAIDFIIDVQRITERALEHKPELQAAWFALLEGQETIKPALEHGLVAALGKKYQALSPYKYFRNFRRGSVDAQRRAA